MASSNDNMDIQIEEQILQKISALEVMEQEYYANHDARGIAMQLGPGDVRAAGLLQERLVQEQAFRRLIGTEKLKLQKIRAAEEEKRRAEARAAKERQRVEEEAAKKATKEAARKQSEQEMKQHEDAVQRAITGILTRM